MSEARQRCAPNDPCWCGSGKKYKKCHRASDEEGARALTKGEASGIMRQRIAYDSKYCIHAGAGTQCSGDIIRAHTIQRSGGLSRIARRGEVYCFHEDLGLLLHTQDKLKAVLVGYREASTFTGFCSSHDQTTFLPLETKEFHATPEQVLLLAYRGLCRELFRVRYVLEGMGETKKLWKNWRALAPDEVDWHLWQLEAHQQYIVRQSEQDKAEYDRVLLTQSYADLGYYVVWFKSTPDVLCSSFFQPLTDFDGNRVQEIPNGNARWQGCGFSVIASNQGGAAVLSWMKSTCPSLGVFVRSLDKIPDAGISSALLRLAFEYSGNICMSPQWWEQLSDGVRQTLIKRAHSNLTYPQNPWCLKDDGVVTANWPVDRREINI